MQGAGGIGGLLTQVDIGAVKSYAYLYDGNGNVGQLIDNSDGSIDAHYEYDPYGNSILASGAVAAGNPYRFSTKYLDDNYGLYYYGLRFYDPDTGRWLNRDPIDVKDGQSLYNFVLNDPIKNFDKDGLTTYKPKFILNYVNLSSIKTGKCGLAWWGIRWLIKGAENYERDNGVVAQKIVHSLDIKDQNDNDITTDKLLSNYGSLGNRDNGKTFNYTERWYYAHGKIPSSLKGMEDHWRTSDFGLGTKGRITIEGLAFYARFDDLIWPNDTVQFNEETRAGPLISTTGSPTIRANAKTSNNIHRKLVIEWNCCCGEEEETEIKEVIE